MVADRAELDNADPFQAPVEGQSERAAGLDKARHGSQGQIGRERAVRHPLVGEIVGPGAVGNVGKALVEAEVEVEQLRGYHRRQEDDCRVDREEADARKPHRERRVRGRERFEECRTGLDVKSVADAEGDVRSGAALVHLRRHAGLGKVTPDSAYRAGAFPVEEHLDGEWHCAPPDLPLSPASHQGDRDAEVIVRFDVECLPDLVRGDVEESPDLGRGRRRRLHPGCPGVQLHSQRPAAELREVRESGVLEHDACHWSTRWSRTWEGSRRTSIAFM